MFRPTFTDSKHEGHRQRLLGPARPALLHLALKRPFAMLQDALNEIARQRSKDLFKPLRVHFIGEDGIDAGGVKKEFFQLLMTELLSPDYGMLVFQPVRASFLEHY